MEKKEYKELKRIIAGGFSATDEKYQELKQSVTDGFSKTDKDYIELKQSVIEGFSKTEQDTEELRKSLDFIIERAVTKDEVEEIVKEVVKEELVEINGKVDEVRAILDDQSRYFQEQEMIKGQLDRHDGWIHKIAGKTGTKLEY